MSHSTNQDKSYIRIFHAAPNAPGVDVYANNNLVARNLSYRNFTDYLPIPAGTVRVKVFPTGEKTNPLIDTSLEIIAETITTVAAIGQPPNISLLPVEDPRIPIEPGKSFLRFANLAPTTPNLDLSLPGGPVLFKDVEFKEVTDYISVSPKTYTIELFPTGTKDRILYVPNMTLQPNNFYTVYAIGGIDDSPPLQVVIPLDGNSYIQ